MSGRDDDGDRDRLELEGDRREDLDEHELELEVDAEETAGILRRVTRMVLAAHLAELANSRDEWPVERPSDALRDLNIGEASVLEHVDRVLDRILVALVRGTVH